MLNFSMFHSCNGFLYSFIFKQTPPDSKNQSMFETRKKKLYKHCSNIQQRNIHRFLQSLENYFFECPNCIEFVRYVDKGSVLLLRMSYLASIKISIKVIIIKRLCIYFPGWKRNVMPSPIR